MNRRTLLAGGLAGLVVPSVALAQPQPMVRRMRAPATPAEVTGDTADVPFVDDRAMPVVEVRFENGSTGRFGMDTGAPGHGSISGATAERLGLPVAGRGMTADPSGRNGVEIRVFGPSSLLVGDVRFGGLTLTEMPAMANALTPLDGILGVDLFRDLILTLDYRARRLKIRRGALPAPDGRMVLEAPSAGDPFMTVQLTIGEHRFPAHLDTGQGRAPLILPQEVAMALPRRGEPRTIGRARTVSQVIEMMAVDITEPVRLGAVTLPVTQVAWPPPIPMANLGSLGLRGLVLEVDRVNGRIALRSVE